MLLVLFLNLLLCFQPYPHVKAHQHSSNSSSQQLDTLLQQYAYKALVNPTTGTIYNATQQLPSDLFGIKVAALRLRSGSLRRKGYKMYNEFSIPKGLIETPYVERLVLVYQNLGNNLSTSSYYYPLLNYTYLTPILGLIAYDGSNLSATNLHQVLHINATLDPIIVKFHDVKSPPQGTSAKCVWFDLLNGASNFSNVGKGNTCYASQQGHFSIVVNSNNATTSSPKGNKSEISNKVWKIIIIILVCVVGGIALVVVLSFLVLWMKKLKQKKRMQKMEKAADVGEPLHMTYVGYTKAPSATVTRTQPTLEHEYAI